MLSIPLVFEDAHLLVVSKPPGIAFHSTDEAQGIVERVRLQYQSDALFPVHRLDKVTSGLMIFARSAQTNAALSVQFEQRTIEKYYLALSDQKPKKKQGTVSGDMAKSRAGSYKLLRSHEHPAITRLYAKGIAATEQKGHAATNGHGHPPRYLMLLKPETGKTHQLRVAMKALGCPILGDRRYGGHASDRVYLHAWRKRFRLYDRDYDLCDLAFSGERIGGDVTHAIQQYAEQLLTLRWPKGSFLLPR